MGQCVCGSGQIGQVGAVDQVVDAAAVGARPDRKADHLDRRGFGDEQLCDGGPFFGASCQPRHDEQFGQGVEGERGRRDFFEEFGCPEVEQIGLSVEGVDLSVDPLIGETSRPRPGSGGEEGRRGHRVPVRGHGQPGDGAHARCRRICTG